MRNYENVKKLIEKGIGPHQIVLAYTDTRDYEETRDILLEDVRGIENCTEYLLIKGYHCSCYDFNDTEWVGIVYTKNELLKLADANYNKENPFWNQVKLLFK